MAAKKLRRSV